MIRGNIYSLFLLIGLFTAVSAVDVRAEESDALRWGISTQKKLDRPAEDSGSNSEMDSSVLTPKEVMGRHAGSIQEEGPESQAPLSDASLLPPDAQGNTESTVNKESLHENAASMPDIVSALPGGDPVPNGTKKVACEACLENLRALFLKTRHYSIQGASCETRDQAKSFLNLYQECRTRCTEKFLEENGYTDRIVRNIAYLEKLGRDQCNEDEVVEIR